MDRVLRQTLAIAEPRNIAIIEEDDMKRNNLARYRNRRGAGTYRNRFSRYRRKKQPTCKLSRTALSEGETAGTWRLAIEVAMGYEHRIYNAGTNAMIV
jgi:hypothetical protein